MVLLLGVLLTSLVLACSAATTTSPGAVQNIRDEFLQADTAHEMAVLCAVVYRLEDEGFLNFTKIPSQYQLIGWIDQVSTEVLIVESDSKLIVVFRGTEETADWILNLDDEQVPFGPTNHTVPYDMYEPNTQGEPTELSVLAHRGFNQAFKVYDQVLSKIQPLLDGKNNTVLHVTGHSLGGANAQLFGTYFAFHNPRISVYLSSFSSPRCGNRGFKMFSESLANLNAWRIVNLEDVVPRLPFARYHHAGHLLWRRTSSPPSESSAIAYYRQIGNTRSKGMAGVPDFGVAFLRAEDVEELLETHYMPGIIEWLEQALADPLSYYTEGFATI